MIAAGAVMNREYDLDGERCTIEETLRYHRQKISVIAEVFKDGARQGCRIEDLRDDSNGDDTGCAACARRGALDT